MPLLGGSSSPFDEILEKATNETNTSENWALIMDICDRIESGGAKGAKDGLLALKKRLNHRDPHVVMLALSVLDSCWSNCGLTFQKEICSREFIGELRSKATGSNQKIAERTRQLLKKWAENEGKNEASLSLVAALYRELHRDGYLFTEADPPKKQPKVPKDPNYVSSLEEEDAIAKAIQASLKEQKQHEEMRPTTTTSLYPTAVREKAGKRSVKALYDFEAAEDNELTFKAGEIITLMDDSDMNWWKGVNQRGEGLFPASFVTADLSFVIDTGESEPKKKTVQFDENVEVKEVEMEVKQEPVRIDEEKLNQCLELLDDADPTGAIPDPAELLMLEEQCGAMGPLIDGELAEVDRKHNLLAEVDVKLRDALALYDQAMADASAQFQAHMQQMASQYQPQQYYQQADPSYAQVAQMPPAAQPMYQAPVVSAQQAPPPGYQAQPYIQYQ